MPERAGVDLAEGFLCLRRGLPGGRRAREPRPVVSRGCTIPREYEVDLKDRIGAVGGKVDILSSPGGGTRVQGTIPFTP